MSQSIGRREDRITSTLKKSISLGKKTDYIRAKSHLTNFLEFDRKVNSFVDIIYIDLQRTFVLSMVTVKS